MPTNYASREYYGSYYNPPIISDVGEEITFDDSLRFGRHLSDMILRYPSDAHVSILDFGGGDGSLSYSVARQLLKRGAEGINITVIDYHDKTVLPQDSRISINRLAAFADVSPLYSIVIASAIIEHLPRPRETLFKLLNHVERGGFFYARTPYVIPLMNFCRLIGVKWDFAYPAHIHDLGQDFWETYFRKNKSIGDFQILESRPSIVETTFKKHFLRTVAACSLKAPWYLLGRRYKLVGGWEVFVRKHPGQDVGIKTMNKKLDNTISVAPKS